MTKRRRTVVVLGFIFALVGLLGFTGATPAAHAGNAPPVFADGHGLTVVKQPWWVDGAERTFKFVVRTVEVPEYSTMAGQNSGEHVIMVTLPEGYDSSGATRYPVQYHLHGHPDYPDTALNQQMFEESTAGGVPLINVAPNGSGRGWYTNWVNPPAALGPQNWQNFHLDQVIPFVDANLRTIAARQGRAISGHSMGGFGAFHYAQSRPELFGYVGSFSGGLDLLNQAQRAAVVATTQLPGSGTPTVAPDAIFGVPVWPLDTVWNEKSPAQHVESLRGMGVAMYTGNGGNLADNPPQALTEHVARETNLVTRDNLVAAGIPHTFIDYGDGSTWAEGCNGKHAQPACLKADMNHFVGLLMKELAHP
ncbi:S-formylglutathione hydrolase FrmB [Saccharomonospora amisosensis]|uniref:S-formylglutathione hydrolase FrmB n=1 Tax=Saccharomonospora amisosensis TaxID=1128677 RepID=A0A7X5ZPF3_9PSEU|nr:alpha/beta hydrolase-fold protein [Saccharomonospora amisosensis]NIJ10421.1 S-formylglutathione hydrolase FrmB [Saccharomonospora amisosensis]